MSGRLLLGVLRRRVVLFRNVCVWLGCRLRIALIVFLNEGTWIFAGHRGIGLGHEIGGSA
ncbi:hypothetical protein LNAOJCKE_5487 [Methylorubrum aminovorans]|uniref:Uncharacterized protein n=1 Tax=Methylorubrum aminovorans TaxID=269069 RepID=A0ABQ4UQ89_9HYPH|nr:hypothetical protein LNAOJCKE_5487 [Methylorubrum aminovorans]